MDWYYSDASGRNGPVSAEAFEELVRSGVVRDNSLVWNAGMANWEPYGSIRAVTPMMAAGPPSLPMAPVPAEAAPAFCSQCGRRVTSADLVPIGGRPVCGFCKPALLQQMREGTAALGAGTVYGGFWIRFVASLIDSTIVTVVNLIFISVLVGGVAATSDNPSALMSAGILSYLTSLVFAVIYEGYFLVNKGATPGKMALGLRVIPVSGGPFTWGKAIGRYFGKMVSGMTLGIGFIIAAFDAEKRTLHDRICDTRVIKG